MTKVEQEIRTAYERGKKDAEGLRGMDLCRCGNCRSGCLKRTSQFTASQIFEELELIENEEQINIWQMNGDVARKYRDLKSKYLKEKSE